MPAKHFSQKIGKQAEDFACHYLQAVGLKLITRNFRCRTGEIDLIMQDKKELVFVEVRYRCREDFGEPAETITLRKQHKLFQAASYYLQQNQLTNRVACRFDVLALTAPLTFERVQWIQNVLF